MPLKPGPSHLEENFHELRHGDQYARTAEKHGKETARAQMIAIAMKEARKHRATGGRAAAEAVLPEDHQLGLEVPKGGSCCANCVFLASATECGNRRFIEWNDGSGKLPEPADRYCCDLWSDHAARARGGKVKIGAIRGDGEGRHDIHEAKVANGSFIINADTISHMGASNTDAGLKKAQEIFGIGGHYDKSMPHHRDAGGGVEGEDNPVDCILASGEFSVAPRVVRKIGGGDIDRGHRILDKFMMDMRKDHIRVLSQLPGPARD